MSEVWFSLPYIRQEETWSDRPDRTICFGCDRWHGDRDHRDRRRPDQSHHSETPTASHQRGPERSGWGFRRPSNIHQP